jgi:FkbM family methyltransferase
VITRCILKILHFIYQSAMSLSALVGIKPDTLRQWMTVLARPFLHLWFFKNPRPLSLNHFKVYWRPSWLILDWITGKYEPGTTRIMEHLVHPGMTVVDIGANIGYYVLQESEILGSDGNIFAVEPVPQNLSYLCRNIALNRISNVVVYERAVGAKASPAKMYLQRESNLGSLVPPVTWSETREVNVNTLDGLFPNALYIDLVRMDIEDFEAEALREMKNILNKYRPCLFIELHTLILKFETSKNFLLALQGKGFETEYLVDKVFEHALVSGRGSGKYIETLPIDKLLNDGSVRESRATCMIFLKNTMKIIG